MPSRRTSIWTCRRTRGRLIFLRRGNGQGEVQLLGRVFVVDRLWQQRLVRAEVDLKGQQVLLYTLRRAPEQQPMVKKAA